MSNLFQNCVILLLMNLWLHLINHKYVTRVVLTLHCGWRKIRFLPTTEETFHLYLERLMKMERRMHHHNGNILHNIMLQGKLRLNDVNYISTNSIKYMWFIHTFSNGDQNSSKAGAHNDKRKENKKSSKSETCTTKCEGDLIDDQGNYSSSFLTRHLLLYYHYHTYILYHLFAIKLINYPDGMQQLLVESEGGTVLFQSTNVTILPPGVTSNNGYIK